jgi:small basic protein
MIVIVILLLAGFAVGYYLHVPFELVGTKYLALLFLGLLDGITLGLSRDLTGQGSATDRYVLTRLVVGLILGGFLIYFGEKSHVDLYLVALLPFALGFALNMYKFLPK